MKQLLKVLEREYKKLESFIDNRNSTFENNSISWQEGERGKDYKEISDNWEAALVKLQDTIDDLKELV